MPKINDCFALRPDLLKYFVKQNDALGLPVNSKKRVDLKCPKCGTLKNDSISNLANFGFSCGACGDGISYPEKMMY